jgi:asparagine synthase (glutamine-hydrolysing)
VLGHTRLSIVDPSPAGHQPMFDRPRDAGLVPNVVTFNGELYNFRDLAEQTRALGWEQRTRTDTEILLHAYRVWGFDAVERFEGMFAFCLVDPQAELIWLCRDRMGMKPLYVYRPPRGGLLFASELRALLVAPAFANARLNPVAIESFLAQGAVVGNASIVLGVELLAAGTSIVCAPDGTTRRSERYWSVAFGSARGAATSDDDVFRSRPSRTESVLEIRAGLEQALTRLSQADVPVGLFLSSGVDSAALATIAKRTLSEPLHTVAIGFDEPEFDESRGADAVARLLGTRHRTVRLSGREVLADFELVLAALDQPTVDGFNSYFVSRAAKSAGITVALSGVGGDELFGGYASFVDVPRARRWFHWLSHPTIGSMVPSLVRPLARAVASHREGLARALFKLAELPERKSFVSTYLLRREVLLPDQRRSLLRLPRGSDPVCGIPSSLLHELATSHEEADPLDRVAFLEFSVYLQNQLLRDADAMSMAHALELRLPFLERSVVEAAARAGAQFRAADPRPKPLLVDAAGPDLPALVRTGKKRGFTFPWNAWFRGPLREAARSRLAAAPFADLGLEVGSPDRLWQTFARGELSAIGLLGLLVLADFCARHRVSL